MTTKEYISAPEEKKNNEESVDASRRNFLKTALAESLALSAPEIFGAGEVAAQSHNITPKTEKKEDRRDVEEIVNEIKERYGISVRFCEGQEMVKGLYQSRAHIFLEACVKNPQFAQEFMQECTSEECAPFANAMALYKDGDPTEQNAAVETVTKIIGYGDTVRNIPLSEDMQRELVEDVLDDLQMYPEGLLRDISADKMEIIISSYDMSLLNRLQRVLGDRSFGSDGIGGFYEGVRACQVPQIYIRAMRDADEKIDIDNIFSEDVGVSEDVQAYFNENDAVLHHELFHRMDEVFYGQGDFNKNINTNDEHKEWKEIIKNDIFGSGYVTQYGKEDVFEDRAETASMLFVPWMQRDIMRRARHNKTLQKKVSVIKDYYWHWSGGIMDDAYWDRIREEGDGATRQYILEKEHAMAKAQEMQQKRREKFYKNNKE